MPGAVTACAARRSHRGGPLADGACAGGSDLGVGWGMCMIQLLDELAVLHHGSQRLGVAG